MAIPAPHRGPWTEHDLHTLPEDGQRYELLEGHLVVSPSPGSLHQWVAGKIYRILSDAASPHLGAVEAVGVRIPGDSFMVPDVLVAHKVPILANASVLEPDSVQLVVEVVSPGSVIMDKVTKPLVYAQAGIRNFWRVDLAGPSVSVYGLMDRSYQEMRSAQKGDLLTLNEPFSIRLDPADLIR
jgi:Uma2 family endonuclease